MKWVADSIKGLFAMSAIAWVFFFVPHTTLAADYSLEGFLNRTKSFSNRILHGADSFLGVAQNSVDVAITTASSVLHVTKDSTGGFVSSATDVASTAGGYLEIGDTVIKTIWCSVTDFFGFSCSEEESLIPVVEEVPQSSSTALPPSSMPPMPTIVSTSTVVVTNTRLPVSSNTDTKEQTHITYVTNPLSVLNQYYFQSTNVEAQEGSDTDETYITRSLLRKQVDSIYDSFGDSLRSLRIDLGDTIETNKLTVNGSLNLDGVLNDSLGASGINGMVLKSTGLGVEWVATSTLGYASASQIGVGTAGQFPYYAVNGTNLVPTSALFLSGSNIGIGTTTPSEKLTVSGNGFFSGNLEAQNFTAIGTLGVSGLSTLSTLSLTSGTSTNFYTANLGVNSEYFTDLTGAGLVNINGALSVSTTTLNLGNNSFIGLSDTDQTSFIANRIVHTNAAGTGLTDTAGFVFTGTNLGVGTSSPATALDVTSSVFAGSTLRRSGTGGIGMAYINSTNSNWITGVGAGSGSPFGIYRANDAFGTQFNIQDNGNVGIGTTTPGQLLSVNGNAFIGGNLQATGTLALSGAAALSSTLNVSGLSTLSTLSLTSGTSTNFAITGQASTTQLTVSGNAQFNGITNVQSLSTSRLVATDGSDNLVSTITVANLVSSVSDLTGLTGTGNLVLSNSPVFITPNLGTPSAVTLTNGTGLPISTGVSGLGTGIATFLGTPTSANLATALTDESGSGAAVFGTFTSQTLGDLMSWNGSNWVNVATSTLGFGSGTVGGGTTGQIPYYAANGTTLIATSSLFIAANGNVGIGTTTPYRKLSVTDTSAAQLALAYDTANSTQFQTNSAGNLLITPSGGRIGIGTTSPSAPLSVVGNVVSTGQFLADGTVGAPAFSSVSNPTTGFYWLSSGTTGYSQNGSTRFVWGGDQNMGSGVALNWKSASTGNGGSTDVTLSRASAGVLQLGTTAANALGSLNLTNLIASGNVQATGTLQVTGLSTLSTLSLTSGTSTNFYTANLGVNSEYFTDLTGAGLVNINGALSVSTTTLNLGNNSFIGLSDTDQTSFIANRIVHTNAAGTGLTDTAGFVFSGGNLGIGTTTPSSILTIAGSAITDTTIQITNTDTTLSAGQQLGALDFYSGDVSANGNGVMAQILAYSINTSNGFGNLGFMTRSTTASALTERMTILHSGQIGIGITSPTELLHVSGNGLFTGSVTATALISTSTITASATTTAPYFAISSSVGATAPDYTWTADTDTGMYRINSNIFGFATGGVERWRIDSSGRMIAGGAVMSVNGNSGNTFQIFNTGSAGMNIARFSNDAFSSVIAIGKSRGATIGTYAPVGLGDDLASFQFVGDDGISLANGLSSLILVEVDGAVSSGIVPGRMTFLTTNASGVSTQALRLNMAQQALFADGASTSPSLSFLNDTNTGIYSGGADIVNFSTGGINRMSLIATGDLGIGTTTPSARLSVRQSVNTSSGGVWIAESGNTDFRSIFMNTSGVMSFYGGDTAGTLNTATLGSAGDWISASDRIYKDNIQDISYGLEALMELKPRSYTIKNTDNHKIGFIAQELELVIPEVVEGKDGSKGVSYGNLVAVAIKAIQELSTKVTQFAESFTTKFIKTEKIETDTLCVGSICVTESELQELLNGEGNQGGQSEQAPPSQKLQEPSEEEGEEVVSEVETPSETEGVQEGVPEEPAQETP